MRNSFIKNTSALVSPYIHAHRNVSLHFILINNCILREDDYKFQNCNCSQVLLYSINVQKEFSTHLISVYVYSECSMNFLYLYERLSFLLLSAWITLNNLFLMPIVKLFLDIEHCLNTEKSAFPPRFSICFSLSCWTYWHVYQEISGKKSEALHAANIFMWPNPKLPGRVGSKYFVLSVTFLKYAFCQFYLIKKWKTF